MRQWQCPDCGQWVDMTHLKHIHSAELRPLSLVEMHHRRLYDPSYHGELDTIQLRETPWRPEYPRRDKPSE